MAWTITIDNLEKSVADLGFRGLIVTLTNQGIDTLRFEAPSSFTETPSLVGKSVVLRRGREWQDDHWVSESGSIVFSGTIAAATNQATSNSEFAAYTAYGPWRALERTLYGQQWAGAATGGSVKTSHVFVNAGVSMKGQIEAVISAAIAAGIPMQAGTIDEMGVLPMSQCRDIMLAEVIRQELRWAPDAVAWFDYSTSPPKLHCRRAANLPAVNIPLDGTVISECELTPRHDLIVPSVCLFFEFANQVDGREMLSIMKQIWPMEATGFEQGALVGTFDFEGPQITHDVKVIRTRQIHADSLDDNARLEWWKDHCPELRNSRIQSLSIPYSGVRFYSVGIEPDASEIAGIYIVGSGWDNTAFARGEYAKRIQGGTVMIFRAAKNGTAVGDPLYQQSLFQYIATIRADVTNDRFGGNELLQDSDPLTRWLEVEHGFIGEVIEVVANVTQTVVDPLTGNTYTDTLVKTVRIVMTNAVSGEYTTVTSFVQGETPPDGLAEFLYNVGQKLHYDGSIVLHESECSQLASVGNVVNIPGGPYAAMNAIVQQCVMDIDWGITTLMLGTPKHLGPSDLIEWVRAFRRRRVWLNPAIQSDGDLASGVSHNDYSHKAPVSEASHGSQTPQRMKMFGAGGSVDINPEDSGGKTITLRELNYCDNGTMKKIRVLASAPYTP